MGLPTSQTYSPTSSVTSLSRPTSFRNTSSQQCEQRVQQCRVSHQKLFVTFDDFVIDTIAKNNAVEIHEGAALTAKKCHSESM